MCISSMQGVEVDVHLVDGRNYRGIFYTATPFHGKKFELALKAATATAPTPSGAGKAVVDPSLEVEAGSTILLAFSDLKTLTVSKKNVADNEEGRMAFLLLAGRGVVASLASVLLCPPTVNLCLPCYIIFPLPCII